MHRSYNLRIQGYVLAACFIFGLATSSLVSKEILRVLYSKQGRVLAEQEVTNSATVVGATSTPTPTATPTSTPTSTPTPTSVTSLTPTPTTTLTTTPSPSLTPTVSVPPSELSPTPTIVLEPSISPSPKPSPAEFAQYSLFGYTSSRAKVLLDGISTLEETQSREDGYFEFINFKAPKTRLSFA